MKNTHKRLRLTEINRREIWQFWQSGRWRKCDLARKFNVSRPTIYKILNRARAQELTPRNSTNARFRTLKYGLRRLAKIEKSLQEKLKKQAKRYEKSYPGEMIHFDTKRLPMLKNETSKMPREYLFIAIDDFSRELFATILPDKSADSAKKMLDQVLDESAYEIERAYSDNGMEYRGTKNHPFVKCCAENGISQRFTRVRRPQTNGKAERVIRTLLEMWHSKIEFKSRQHRRVELIRFINFYNCVKPHSGIENLTLHEKLLEYFCPKKM